jgi:hypothetical protein
LSNIEIPINYQSANYIASQHEVKYVSFCFTKYTDMNNVVITVDEEIKYAGENEYEWFIYNTGETLIPSIVTYVTPEQFGAKVTVKLTIQWHLKKL